MGGGGWGGWGGGIGGGMEGYPGSVTSPPWKWHWNWHWIWNWKVPPPTRSVGHLVEKFWTAGSELHSPPPPWTDRNTENITFVILRMAGGKNASPTLYSYFRNRKWLELPSSPRFLCSKSWWLEGTEAVFFAICLQVMWCNSLVVVRQNRPITSILTGFMKIFWCRPFAEWLNKMMTSFVRTNLFCKSKKWRITLLTCLGASEGMNEVWAREKARIYVLAPYHLFFSKSSNKFDNAK